MIKSWSEMYKLDISKFVKQRDKADYLPWASCLKLLYETKGNEYNLNIPRYVDTVEEEELIDIDEVKQNIANIEAELVEVQAQMKKYMEELGL